MTADEVEALLVAPQVRWTPYHSEERTQLEQRGWVVKWSEIVRCPCWARGGINIEVRLALMVFYRNGI